MAVDWLKQVIDNKDLKDDMVVTLAGGQSIPLGDIRSLTKAQQKLLSDKEANLVAREADLRKNLDTLQAAQAETAKLYADLQNQRGTVDDKSHSPAKDALETLESDAILGPIAKAIRSQQAAIDKFNKESIEPVIKAQQDMAKAYVTHRISDMYRLTVPADKRSTVTLESLLKVANDNGLKDAYGIPDVERAYLAVSTKPITEADLAKQLAEAKEAGRKEAMDQARLRVPRPGIGAVSGRPESSFRPTIGENTTVSGALSEALAAAAKDSDIWKNVDDSLIQ
jgi:hypothetical protein